MNLNQVLLKNGINISRKRNTLHQVQLHVHYVVLKQTLNLQVKRNQVQFHVYVRNVKVNYND